MKKGVIIALMCLGLAGCSSFGRGFAEGILGKSAHEPKACLMWSSGFEGIADTTQNTTKVMITHGAGTRTEGYATPLILNLTQHMHFDTRDYEIKTIAMRGEDGSDLGILRLSRFINETGQEMVFYELNWSSITAATKQQLAYDGSGEYAAERSSVNHKLKYLGNDMMADSVAFMGPLHHRLVDAGRMAICFMINSDYATLPDHITTTCQIDVEKAREQIATADFVFITHSLGSCLTLDALEAVTDYYQELQPAFQNMDVSVFMLANQLPLFRIDQQGYQTDIPQGTYADYCQPGGKHYAERRLKTLQVVAFSDPNDLLSYSLEPNTAPIHAALCPQVSNISIETVPAADILGTKMTHPLAAHTTYKKDSRILALMVFGLHADKSPPDTCRWIQLTHQKESL